MSIDNVLLLLIPSAPIAAALLLALLRIGDKRVPGWVAALAAALSLGASLALVPALRTGDSPTISVRWIPAANISLSMHLDWLGLPFLVTEAGVALVAVIYTWGYHKPDSRTPYFYALLLLFAAGMSGTTLANDMFLFYIFWELMLVASCALIAMWGEGAQRGQVALKYFIFTHLGSLMVLVGLLVLYNATGNDSFADLQVGVALTAQQLTTVVVLFVVGFCVKMAIFPLHLWLPDAHAVAPMPVTIMLAAAMLSMGTYGILRFPFSILDPGQLAPYATPMMIAGVVSAIYGALMALAEQDIKRIIAYSSVSQMGYILFGLGTLSHDGIVGGILHVTFHAIVKALLFMGVGLVIGATGRRRISALGGLGNAMPLVAVCTGVGVLAIAGVPPLCVFDSEWMIFSGGFDTGQLALPIVMLFGSLLTVAYALWFFGRVFFGAAPEGLTVRRLPVAMVAPTVLLTALALVEGLLPAPLFGWADNALRLVLGGGW